MRCDNSVDSGCDVTRTNLTPSANRLFVSCLVFEENSFRAFPKLGGGKEREGGGRGPGPIFYGQIGRFECLMTVSSTFGLPFSAKQGRCIGHVIQGRPPRLRSEAFVTLALRNETWHS